MRLHGLNGGNGCREIASGLLHDHSGAGLKRHHVFHRSQLQRFQFFLALGFIVNFFIQTLLQQGQSSFTQFIGFNHRINNTVVQRFDCFMLTTGSDPLHCVVYTNYARHAYCTAEAGKQAQLHFRQTHLSFTGHNTEVCCQTHFQATTQSQPVNGSHRGERQIFNSAECFVGLETPGGNFFLRHLEHISEFSDIGAHNKDTLTTGYDHALN